jgi:spatacsin
LENRVRLCKVISSFNQFRRVVVHDDLLGDIEKIISDLVLNHTLALGQAATECLGMSSTSATKQWLMLKYSTAATPTQVLKIHEEILQSVEHADYCFSRYLHHYYPMISQPRSS